MKKKQANPKSYSLLWRSHLSPLVSRLINENALHAPLWNVLQKHIISSQTQQLLLNLYQLFATTTWRFRASFPSSFLLGSLMPVCTEEIPNTQIPSTWASLLNRQALNSQGELPTLWTTLISVASALTTFFAIRSFQQTGAHLEEKPRAKVTCEFQSACHQVWTRYHVDSAQADASTKSDEPVEDAIS